MGLKISTIVGRLNAVVNKLNGIPAFDITDCKYIDDDDMQFRYQFGYRIGFDGVNFRLIDPADNTVVTGTAEQVLERAPKRVYLAERTWRSSDDRDDFRTIALFVDEDKADEWIANDKQAVTQGKVSGEDLPTADELNKWDWDTDNGVYESDSGRYIKWSVSPVPLY